MKTNQLAIPSKVTPPPTKAEILDALTHLQIKQWKEEDRNGIAERKRLLAEAEAELEDFAATNFAQLEREASIGSQSYHNKSLHSICVRFEIPEKELPQELRAKILKIHKLPTLEREPVFYKVRKMIAAKISDVATKEERVDMLMTDEASKSALETMLKAISK